MHPDASSTTLALELIPHALLLATIIICAYTDVASGRILNIVTLPAIFLGFAVSFIRDGLTTGSPYLIGSAVAVVLGGGIFGLVYLMRGMGAGDVKMMAAISAIAAGWRFALMAAFYSAVVGAAIGVGILIWRGRLGSGLKSSLKLLASLGRNRDATAEPVTFPYGLAIAIGAVWAWVQYILASRPITG